MDRKLCVFVFLIGLFVLSLFFGGETRSVVVEEDDSTFVVGNSLDVYYFYGEGCSHCAKVKPFLDVMEQKYPLEIHRYDIYTNRDYLSLFDEYSNRYGLPSERRGVPTVFVSDTYFVGDTSILDGFEEVVKKALEESLSIDQVEISEVSEKSNMQNERVHSVCVTTKPNNQEGILHLVNVSAFNGSNLISSGISNISGIATLTNVLKGNLTFVAYAKSDYSQVIANVTVYISSEGQSFDLICGQNYGEVSSNWEIIIFALSMSMLLIALPLLMFSSRIRIKKHEKGDMRPS